MEVVILAGGLGTRLRTVVSDLPKCLAPVAGKPFLWYILENLRRFDVSRVILSVGYLHEAVESWIGEHSGEYPFEFCFAVEETPLGTGGAIKLAASMAEGSELIVLNGDTFFDVDLDGLLDQRRRSGAAIALALKPMRDFDRYGTVDLGSDGIIRAFKEKQYCSEGLINGGVYAIDLRSNLFDGMPDKFSFEKEVLEPLCTERRLSGLVQQGYFIDIGIPEDYSKADSEPELLRHPSGLLGIIQTLEGFDTLLLDRDGVINRLRQGDYVKKIEEFEWLPGVKQALKIAAEKFKGIYVVTNQRGVGKGLMLMETLNGIHEWMCREISDAGGRIDGVYVCTAVSDDDPRRKPNTGMFADLLRDHPEVEAEKTIMIGDSASDRVFARDSGISFFII